MAVSPCIAASATALLIAPALLSLTKHAQKTDTQKTADTAVRRAEFILATCDTGYRSFKKFLVGQAIPLPLLPGYVISSGGGPNTSGRDSRSEKDCALQNARIPMFLLSGTLL